MKRAYDGFIVADICEARFAYSGMVSWIGKRVGDSVKKGEVIASLDKKLFQMELDRQLADYDKTRAEFEITNAKQHSSDEFSKYLSQINQSKLNVSVKDVELAKYRMDQVNLFSPVNGMLLEMQELRTMMHITPSSNPVKILDTDSLRFSFEIDIEDIDVFKEQQEVHIRLKGIKDEYEAKTIVPVYLKNSSYLLSAYFVKVDGLYPGMKGVLKV